MAHKLLPVVQNKFWYDDGSNRPLSRGSISFKIAGSQFNAPTYAAKDGSLNPNPVPLDINGSADIWLDSSYVYDIFGFDVDGAPAFDELAVTVDSTDLDVANKLDKVMTTPQIVNGAVDFVKPIDFSSGLLADSGYFGPTSPNIVFDADAEAYIHDNPGTSLTIRKLYDNNADASLTLSKETSADGIASLSSNGADTSLSSVDLHSGSATTPTYQEFKLENADGGTVGTFKFTGSGLDVQNPNPNDGSGIKMPDGSWIRPQTPQQSLFITNGANPAPMNSALALVNGLSELTAGDGTTQFASLQMHTNNITFRHNSQNVFDISKTETTLYSPSQASAFQINATHNWNYQKTRFTDGIEVLAGNVKIDTLAADTPIKTLGRNASNEIIEFDNVVAGGQVDSVVAGSGITIDNTDPVNPIINAPGISTNATDIATNTSDIATNTSDIATNTSNIATNTSGIGTNATNIATNASNISTNTSNIATNTSNIAGKLDSVVEGTNVTIDDADPVNPIINVANVDLQTAYNNSTTPEILTDATRGALTLKRGSASDSDNILEGKNGAGDTTSKITGKGSATFEDAVTIGEGYTGSFPLTIKSTGSNFFRSQGDGNIGWSGKKLDGTSRFFFNSQTGPVNNFFLDLYSLDGLTSQDIFKATYNANFEIYRNLEVTERILQGSVTDNGTTGIIAESLKIEGESNFNDDVFVVGTGRFNNPSNSLKLAVGFNEANDSTISLYKNIARIGSVKSRGGAFSLVADAGNILELDGDTINALSRILQGSVTDDGTSGIIGESLKIEGESTFDDSLNVSTTNSSFPIRLESSGNCYIKSTTDSDIGWNGKQQNGDNRFFVESKTGVANTFNLKLFSIDGSTLQNIFKATYDDNFEIYRNLEATERILQGSVTDDTSTGIQADSIRSDGDVKADTFTLDGLNTAPSSASDTGTTGEVRWDDNFMYVCTATNTWKRSAIATW